MKPQDERHVKIAQLLNSKDTEDLGRKMWEEETLGDSVEIAKITRNRRFKDPRWFIRMFDTSRLTAKEDLTWKDIVVWAKEFPDDKPFTQEEREKGLRFIKSCRYDIIRTFWVGGGTMYVRRFSGVLHSFTDKWLIFQSNIRISKSTVLSISKKYES